VGHGQASDRARGEDEEGEHADRTRDHHGAQPRGQRDREARREPSRQPRDDHPQERLRPALRELLERQCAGHRRTDGEQMNVAYQVKPPDPADNRKKGKKPAKRAPRGAQHARAWTALAAAVALVWVGVGIYGTLSYGKAYDTYRGFPPPKDPVGVAPGHIYHEKFYSTALHQRRSALVYTPPGYRAAVARGARFPVLYLLHGAPGHPKKFIDVSAVGVALDTAVNRHLIPPYIIVMPNGSNGTFRSDTEWANTPIGRYESFVIETVHATEHRFATKPGRRFRAIGGYSEGAYAAINIALHHLKLFSIAESWSGYGRAHDTGPWVHATPLQRFDNSPSYYAPTLATPLQRQPLYAFLYSGASDPGMRGQRHLADVLALSGVHVRFATFPGKHDWALWRGQTPRMIDWAGRMFAMRHRPSASRGTARPGPRPFSRRLASLLDRRHP
jgi:enterochelin esterase-like enzyme